MSPLRRNELRGAVRFYLSLKRREKRLSMPQAQLMTMEEQAAIGLKAIELKKQGKLEEYDRMMKQIPLPPYLAKFAKDYFGADCLIKTGWNLTEANIEYGSDWLTK